MLPNDLLPWYTIYQQAQRWLAAGSFEAIVHDLRVMLRLATTLAGLHYVAFVCLLLHKAAPSLIESA